MNPSFIVSFTCMVQVLGLLHVVVYNAASKLDCDSPTEPAVTNSEDLPSSEAAGCRVLCCWQNSWCFFVIFGTHMKEM